VFLCFMTHKEKPANYIWYNPVSEIYEMGPARLYKQKKASSLLSEDFNLLYKLNPTSARIGQKLICELNKARTTQNEKDKFFDLEIAS